jgi:hypothetical protein
MSGTSSAISLSKETLPPADRQGLAPVGKPQRSFFKRSAVSGCLAILAIVGVVLIRTVNLGSDTPEGLPAEQDYGIYVDEGYKTLSARNMVVFGTARWHPGDDYPGWHTTSPITQAAFHLAFAKFGQTLETARMVSVTWFAIFLIAFGIAYYSDRCSPVFWVGLLMLGFQYVLWVSSRTAIFEIAALSVFYAALLLLRRFSKGVITYGIVIAFVGVLATVGIKRNGLVIVAPAVFGILAAWAIQKGRARQLLVFVAVAAGLLVVLLSLRGIGFAVPLGIPLERINLLWPARVIKRFLVNPLLQADPFLVILVHASAISLLLHRPKFFENNWYRASIVSIVFLGMAALATVPGHPTAPNMHLRYCALLLPAFILLIVEWWIAQKQNSGRAPTPENRQFSTYAAIIVVFLLAFDLVFLVGWSLSLFFDVPDAGGHTASVKLPVAAAITFLLWKTRNTILSERVLRTFIFAAMAVFALFNGYHVTISLARPTWQVRTISTELTRVLPEGATVAGGWLPLFAIGTNLRVLYTCPEFNRPERFKELRPSYFLSYDTEGGKIVTEIIEKLDGVKLGVPLLESEYTGLPVKLYPVHYEEPDLRWQGED